MGRVAALRPARVSRMTRCPKYGLQTHCGTTESTPLQLMILTG
jgi:hypothetical protein